MTRRSSRVRSRSSLASSVVASLFGRFRGCDIVDEDVFGASCRSVIGQVHVEDGRWCAVQRHGRLMHDVIGFWLMVMKPADGELLELWIDGDAVAQGTEEECQWAKAKQTFNVLSRTQARDDASKTTFFSVGPVEVVVLAHGEFGLTMFAKHTSSYLRTKRAV